jgi:hypothetical protein
MKKTTVHRIGRRNIKTAVAVFIALLIKVVLMLAIDLPTGQQWSKIIYTPFFGSIAAAYSMHMDREGSLNQAKIRTMGSVVGGLYGMVILVLSEALFINLLGMNDSSILYYFLDFLMVAFAMVFMIHLTVLTHKTYATWIACLTYLSVTVSIRNDFDAQLSGFFFDNAMLNSYCVAVIFALNRILSTIIGVTISICVNSFKLPRKQNREILFVSSLDHAILNSEHIISGFTKYKINELCSQGCNITFATTRTQASLNKIFDGINLKLPLITMNGSAIYSPKDKHYMSVDNIDRDARLYLEDLFERRKVNSFCCAVDDDILQIYHGVLKNEGEKRYYYNRRNNFFDNYVRANLPEDMNACYYVVIDSKEIIESIIREINTTEHADNLDLVSRAYDADGNYFLKINSRSCNKYTRLKELKEQVGAEKLVVFGSGASDVEMMQMADISLCLKTAPDKVKAVATKVLDSDDPDTILKTIEKIYHKKDFEVYKKNLIEEKA